MRILVALAFAASAAAFEDKKRIPSWRAPSTLGGGADGRGARSRIAPSRASVAAASEAPRPVVARRLSEQNRFLGEWLYCKPLRDGVADNVMGERIWIREDHIESVSTNGETFSVQSIDGGTMHATWHWWSFTGPMTATINSDGQLEVEEHDCEDGCVENLPHIWIRDGADNSQCENSDDGSDAHSDGAASEYREHEGVYCRSENCWYLEAWTSVESCQSACDASAACLAFDLNTHVGGEHSCCLHSAVYDRDDLEDCCPSDGSCFEKLGASDALADAQESYYRSPCPVESVEAAREYCGTDGLARIDSPDENKRAHKVCGYNVCWIGLEEAPRNAWTWGGEAPGYLNWNDEWDQPDDGYGEEVDAVMNAGDVRIFDGSWFDAPDGCFAYALCNGDGAERAFADYECPVCDDDDGAAARVATAGVLVVAALVFVA